MTKAELNEELRAAICARNVSEVERLLQAGADPNFAHPPEVYGGLAGYELQPYSPLRLVVFIISDALIREEELARDAEVAALLLRYGADPGSAMELAVSRYGAFDPDADDTAFMKVLRIVEEARKQKED